MWDLSCPDWQERIRAGRSLRPTLPLNEAEAARAIGIYNMLRLPDVPGTPSLREAGADWFREIVGAVFGSLDDTTGERMIREVFNLVPKKNSKTTNGAALMMTALLFNERPRAEFVLTGPTQEVADLAFSQAQGMIECDETGFLQKRMHVQVHIKTITDRRTKAKLRIKTFDASVVTGPKPAGVLIDELHEIAKIKDAENIIGQLRGGMVSQLESFLIFITTQSDKPPVGAFRAELMQARAIRDGTLKGVPMLPILYEFPPDMQKGGDQAAWRDASNWWMVTPNANKSIRVERLVSDYTAAQAKGEGEIRRWASQHLNIEIGLALMSDAWAGTKYWERQVDETIATLDALLARCEVVVVGIDGGGLDDLLGLCVLGRDRETRDWLAWHHTWAHEGVLEIRKSEAPKLRDFEKAGHLTIVARAGDHFVEAAAIVERVDASGKLPDRNAIGMDSVGTGLIVDALDEKQLGNQPDKPPRVIAVSQGWKLNGAIKTTEVMLARGTLWHGGQPILAWAVGNAKVEPRGNAISITKQAAGTAKIDPLMALFNAVALMAMNPEAAGSFPSDYELPVIG